MLIFCDIDNTVADISERETKAGKCPSKKDKRAYQLWLDNLQDPKDIIKDKPIKEVIWALQKWNKIKNVRIIYLTSRSNKLRRVTQRWLDKYKCPKAKVYMRSNNDYSSSAQYKGPVMQELIKKYKGHQILILDDDGEGNCSKMYKRNGWCHWKVMWNV